MKFNEKLNEYIGMLECTAKELSSASGLSAATLSRYRSGERAPDIYTEQFKQLCAAIAFIAEKKQLKDITKETVYNQFAECSDIIKTDREQLRQNFNTLISVLNVNINKLCQYINYDSSTIFRFRNGTRQPSDPSRFAARVADYISKEMVSESEKAIMAELFECSDKDLSDASKRFDKVQNWLIGKQRKSEDSITEFLNKLNEFDLNEYIKAIHFDDLKIPFVPFQLSTSKTYYGLKEMMESELDFLKATVLSKSMAPVIMYSDMPMSEMAKDPVFPKKWMFGMAMMLKKGLHLHQIHNLDRSFEDMMLGLESWIPMYMTGQISPYYLKGTQNNVFLHLLKVSGAAALSGEAVSGYHENGKYYMTKLKDEVIYYNKRAEELLKTALPLMDIYREDNASSLSAFMLADSHTAGNRRNILSSLPLYTMNEEYLDHFLKKQHLSETVTQRILNYAALQRRTTEEILKTERIEDEIPCLSKEEFDRCPMTLSLSGMFYESDITYTYEDYLAHLKQSESYAKNHPNYILNQNSANTFRNLQVLIHEGSWAMISKNKSPAIHFVIHHPKLRKAIENFMPPVVEN